jgi:hypothetical protein
MRSLRAIALVLILIATTEGTALCQNPIQSHSDLQHQGQDQSQNQGQDQSQNQGQDQSQNQTTIQSHNPEQPSGPGSPPGIKIALSSGASANALTDEARELAKELNLPGLLANLDQLKTRVQNNGGGTQKTVDTLADRQELLETRQEYEKRVLKASLEVDYVLATIDGEQHRFELMRGDLESNRDSSVMQTNIAAQVSNGVLWVLSCSYTIASRTQPRFDTNDGVNGILAGAIPTVLSLYAFYQLKGRARDLPANPNMLAPLLGTGQDARDYYPKSVLDFLNTVPAGQTVSRRQALIANWIKSKQLNKPDSKNYDRNMQIISGTLAQRRALTLSLLSKQLTMLGDLRTQVCSMKRGILELMPALD